MINWCRLTGIRDQRLLEKMVEQEIENNELLKDAHEQQMWDDFFDELDRKDENNKPPF